MAQKVINKALGLDTFHNELELPEGSLLIADDVIIDRDNIIESRRGFYVYSNALGSSSDQIKQILEYKGRILAHYGETLTFDDGNGAFSSFSGIYPELLEGVRIKGTEINGNFYFTTSNGIKKISATSSSDLTTSANYITDSGAVKALGITCRTNYETSGFLNPDSVTSYRVVWGYKDSNNILILGSPSSVTTIRNIDANESCTVDLQFVIPNDVYINNRYFYQVYRAVQKTPSTQIPEDELNLVIEDFPTDTDLSNGYVSINDPTPEDFRDSGAILYTNPVSGQGILQANEQPPIARDIATFKSSTFYANTVTRHRQNLNLLSLDNFISGSTSLIIGNDDQVDEYIFRGTPEVAHVDFTGFNLEKQVENIDFTSYSYTGSVSLSLDGKYFLKNAASDVRQYFIWFDGTGSTAQPYNSSISLKTALRVNISTALTLSDVIASLKTAIDNNDDFSAIYDSTSRKVTITNDQFGDTSSIELGTLVDGITVGVDTTGIGLDGKYFLKNTASNEREYFIWFDETGGSTATPAEPELIGKIGLQVNIAAVSTSTQIATNLRDALNTIIDFSAEQINSKVVITNSANGNTIDISNGTGLKGLPSPISLGTDVQGTGEDYANKIILLSSQVSNARRIDESARSIVEVINRTSTSTITATYMSGLNDVPGMMSFENKSLTDKPFYIGISQTDVTKKFNPNLPAVHRTVSVSHNTPSSGYCRFSLVNHGFSIGNKIVIFNSTGISPSLNGIHTITAKTTDTFDIAFEAISSGTVDLYLGSIVSDNERSPNRLYYSKSAQPEAVPLLNYFDVGAKDRNIERIIALRDSLFILKEGEGIYRLSGTNLSNFSIALFDASVQITAPDSAAVLNNQIYVLTNQGVVTITDSGVSVISRKIEDQILKYTSPSNYSNFSSIAFGVGYESDRSYLLWLPTSSEDTYGTQCFRYNVFTQTWVRWILPQTCGSVNRLDNKLYLGCGDINYISKERKNFNRTDYADRAYDIELIGNSISGTSIVLSSIVNAELYDVLEQIQYITVSRYNRVLTKLDRDPFLRLTKTSDYIDLTINSGVNLANSVLSLYYKIIADDTIGSYTLPSGTNTIEAIRDDFNRLMTELNNSEGVFYSDYLLYTDIVEYESIIVGIDKRNNTITLNSEIPLLEGNGKIYKSINSLVEWSPQTLGDPSVFKMIRQAYIMFDHFNFTFAEIGFRTDISQDVKYTLIGGEGNGAFGSQVFGVETYGGLGNQKQFRTWIPREKMRSKFLFLQLIHHGAREQFSCVGNGITYNQTASDNQYR